jgi:lipid II:glycine glycyltransferase (peptidoglycan interpeptide bridge formation enzyme)
MQPLTNTRPAGADRPGAPSDTQSVSRAAWDQFLAGAAQAHLLQSSGWADFKARFGWAAERVLYEGSDGQAGFQLLHRPTPVGRIGYLGRGPVADTGTPEGASAAVDAVAAAADRLGLVYVKIEPNLSGLHPTAARRLRRVPPLQPPTTIKIDLAPGEAEILGQFKPKTRYNARLAEKKGVAVRTGGLADLPRFYALMRETGARDRFLVRPISYFRHVFEALGENARLLVAEREGELLAANIVLGCGPEAIYMYGASSNVHRNLMPTYLLQWEGMRGAKAAGYRWYDLWGIPDDADGTEDTDAIADRKGALWGVYRFKRGFGGAIFRHPGAWDLVRSPARYRLWTEAIPRIQRAYHRAFVRGSAIAAGD